jgi:hypothetical protein
MKKQGREKSEMENFPMPALFVWYKNPQEDTQKSKRTASKENQLRKMLRDLSRNQYPGSFRHSLFVARNMWLLKVAARGTQKVER